MDAQNTLLVRSRDGTTVHRRGCTRASRALPWVWAEGKSRAVVKATEVGGIQWCKVCDPLGSVPREGSS